jgi:2'-5' RNA ligase
LKSETGEPTLRLFYALWPSATEQQALAHAVAEAVRDSGGRPVPQENAHLTLAFLGSVPHGRMAELSRIGHECAAALAQRVPLALTFAALAHWARPQILATLPACEPAPLAALAEALNRTTAAAGFTPDLKPFRAHVTVARKVVRPPPLAAMRAVEWHCEGIALVHSRTAPSGPVYSVVESFSLVKHEKARE